MDEHPHIHVKIAEMKTGRGQTVLKTVLGSCVGICFIWKKKGYCGLAHCLLPEAPKSATPLNAKYVDKTVPALLAMMKIKPEDYSEIKAVVVGGGNMMGHRAVGPDHIGILNARSAINAIRALGIDIVHQETGGGEATQFSIECGTGKYCVSHIAKQIREHPHGV